MSNAIYYFAFCAANVILLREVNSIVTKPYMDEPFHVPQAQAYCRGDWLTWDPKITTPPGLYIMSVLLSKLFLFKCNLSVLRLTPLLTFLVLPLVLTRLLHCQRRERAPRELFSPSFDAVAISLFPIAWFFGFLYYTDVPSLVFVVGTVVASLQGYHKFSASLGFVSCMFRQTNIIWVLYAFAYSQLKALQHQSSYAGDNSAFLYDPQALTAETHDWIKILPTIPRFILRVLPELFPYALDVLLFSMFVYWNGGIVLGDKSNHIPAIHIPQLYYFVAFATIFGWPVLIGGPGGPMRLFKNVWSRMFGSRKRTFVSFAATVVIAVTIHCFTIHHPFLLSDNRHYTFYIWHRAFRLHKFMPYIYAPGYLACAWAWYLRVGANQTLLQTIALPLFAAPTLLPTPLLEPRYFLIPYILLRTQIVDVPKRIIYLETIWYALINWATMYVFLNMERPNVGRFMW